ncbi:pyruvate kinase [Candidatus Microgenomates bacterium]|nr:pyruvate kinase [Candidatus Microgenomates bacterium]
MVSTKIIATIGPSCDSIHRIKNLIRAGVNVFRFNLKHNTQVWHSERIARVRQASRELQLPAAILLDLQGPDIRIGSFKDGEILLKKKEIVFFVLSPSNKKRKEIIIDSLSLLEKLEKNHEFTIDDGRFRFRVVGKTKKEIEAKVLEGGILKSQKGVNTPGLELDLPTLVKKDLEDISLAAREDVDFVALSFVRSVQDIEILKSELDRQKLKAKIISKIETVQALQNFEEILKQTDGVMIARGDLGVELALEQVPFYQKEIIKRCLEVGKPVITATQMLESTIVEPYPTRAEVSDVANAIYDFTDAVMLSAESAIGKHPEAAVKMMVKIAGFIEGKRPRPEKLNFEVRHQTAAVTFSAHNLWESEFCQKEKIRAFVVLTETGMSARMLARLRPQIPILALTRHAKIRDQLLLVWGVTPILSNHVNNPYGKKTVEQIRQMLKVIKEKKYVKSGEKVIMVYGEDWGTPGKTSVVRIQEVN